MRSKRLQSAIANVAPAGVLAEQHRRKAEPGSAERAGSQAAGQAPPMTRASSSSSVTQSRCRTPAASLPVVGTALLPIDVINDPARRTSSVVTPARSASDSCSSKWTAAHDRGFTLRARRLT